jgi:selenocysteine lyase/cysteine desulfurase
MYLQRDLIAPSARRGFLKKLTGSAAALSLFPALKLRARGAELAQAAASETASEEFWRLVKEQFIIKEGSIMMNAANLCPAPHTVIEQVCSFTRDEDSDVSFQNRAKFDALREQARKKIATYLGASEDEIAIVRNTSEGNNIIVGGLGLKAGDEVVILDQNHPTNNVAWDVRAARFGFAVKRVSVSSPPASQEEVLAAFHSALTAKTKVLAITDVSSTTGLRMPTRELCRMARERGIYVHVDGAQTFGVLEINLHDLGCDSFAASSHKWFMGPKEAGVLYVRRERIAEIWPAVVGVGWGDKVEAAARGARKFETLGQRNDATLAAMGAAVDFHNLIGPARVEARVRQLTTRLKEGLRKIPGANLLTSMSPELSAGVCVVRFDGIDHRKVYEALYAEYAIAGAAIGGIRLSPHIYNTLEEVDRAAAAIAKLTQRVRG